MANVNVASDSPRLGLVQLPTPRTDAGLLTGNIECPFSATGKCWECVSSFQRMGQRSATGATVHALNNVLMGVLQACEIQDHQLYYEQVQRLTRLMR